MQSASPPGLTRGLLGEGQGSFHIAASPTQLGRRVGLGSEAAEGGMIMIRPMVVTNLCIYCLP